jgi:inosine-uridine nucleoside N-ribohydrolase
VSVTKSVHVWAVPKMYNISFQVPIFRGSNGALLIDSPQDNYFGVDGLGDNENVSYRSIRAERQQAALALIELSKRYEGILSLNLLLRQRNLPVITSVSISPLMSPLLGHRLSL